MLILHNILGYDQRIFYCFWHGFIAIRHSISVALRNSSNDYDIIFMRRYWLVGEWRAVEQLRPEHEYQRVDIIIINIK